MEIGQKDAPMYTKTNSHSTKFEDTQTSGELKTLSNFALASSRHFAKHFVTDY